MINNKKLPTTDYGLRTIFMGTPEIGALLFEHLINSGMIFSGCITRPDKPKGRGKEIAESPVKIVAQKNQIPLFQPNNKAELTELINNQKPDLVIVGAFGMMIPDEALAIPTFGMINFHPSLLPLYRGASPITGPIINGDDKTGVSIITVSSGMDEGDIWLQKEIPLNGTETTVSLSKDLAKLGSEMLAEIIPQIFTGTAKPIPQEHDSATYTKMVKKEDGKIDFTNQTAEEIERMSRAYVGWPGTYSFWNGKKIDFYDLKVINTKIHPGEICLKDELLAIGTKDKGFSPSFIKIEGKNKIATNDFVRGYPDFTKAKL